MFTSKKTLYLNNQFEKLSPITNIDSLYYERVYVKLPLLEGDNYEYDIKRCPVAKHMPINMDVCTNILNSKDNYVQINPDLELFKYIGNASTLDGSLRINTNIFKTHVESPRDKITKMPLHKHELFCVNCSTYIDLGEAINHFVSLYLFNSSIISLLEHYYHNEEVLYNSSIFLDDLFSRIHVDEHNVRLHNNISYIDYEPLQSFNASIYVLDVCINNEIHTVSLDIISTINNTINNYVNKWIIDNYNCEDNIITYLKDHNNNEGPYDFVNIMHYHKNIFGKTLQDTLNYDNCNNRFYCVLYNSSVCVENGDQNIIFNSSWIYINGNNNGVFNSKNSSISGDLNYIYNSDSFITIEDTHCNTIINCNDCSITICGNNNYISNVTGCEFTLSGDNNIIINDNISSVNDEILLNNTRLFLNDSIRMAYDYAALLNNTVLFGSDTHNVSVYADSFKTLK